MICKRFHHLSLQSLRHRRLGEYGCETIFSLSSLGPEFWNSLRNSSPAPSPALINTGSRIMNGLPKDQKYRALFAQAFAPVYYEQEKEAKNDTAHVSSLSSVDLQQTSPFHRTSFPTVKFFA